ncbi:zinc finger protein 14 [Cricetulus griseus]|uniref:Zinc finger protein 14 n=1 Tax=Cricetulus griseus TaxID=10029 RepID=A0A061IJP8_CRIGR|nr:zinc finger protein 14 [Cricetulus griseus]
MAAHLTDVDSFGDPASSLVNASRNAPVEDDDVVFVESIQPPVCTPARAEERNFVFASSKQENPQGNYSIIPPSLRDLTSQKGNTYETIVIDDEGATETNGEDEKNPTNFTEWEPRGNKHSAKTLDFFISGLSRSKTKTGVGPFNPGRMDVADALRNGRFAAHHNPDSWISHQHHFLVTRNSKRWILYHQWPHFLNRISSPQASYNWEENNIEEPNKISTQHERYFSCKAISYSKYEEMTVNAVTYDDVHVNFTWDEWALLDPSQKNLYKEVMLDTYKNLIDTAYNCEDNNVEEPDQISTQQGRNNKINNEEESSQYTQCDKAFEHQSYLQIQDRINTGEKTFEYIQCGKVFANQSCLQLHERTYTGVKPYKCNQCDKGFGHHSSLQQHKRSHTGEKPYKCNQCDKAFTQQSKLRVHEKLHTGEKPFKCNQCDKAFARHDNLQYHKRTHTGEKPYKCNQCDKAFSQKSNLRVHERTHSAEKPYKCTQCGKGFAIYNYLKLHKRTHTGEKPYKCNQCDKAFTQQSNLRVHEQLHTGEKPYKSFA